MQQSRLLLLLGTLILVLGIPISKAETMATMGGLRDIQDFQNSNEINEIAQFAVEQHNTKQNGVLSLSRVVKVQQQVVAGTMYHITLEATEGVGEGAQPKVYEAKVWVKPWQNFKSLEDFKLIPQPGSITSADLGVKKEHLQGSGWREVPVHDPAIQEAAEHAVKNIQQRSNSLAAYVLQEILLAKAEIIDDLAKFYLLLKTKRGAKEEEHKVEMHRSLDGKWMLKSHSV